MDFLGVKEGLEANSILLIDVRNPDEVQNLGKIPGSFNLPLPVIKEAINLGDEEFSQKFGFQKPALNEGRPIVIHCMRGARAEMADNALKEFGYSNTKIYAGSFMDWVAKGGPVEKN